MHVLCLFVCFKLSVSRATRYGQGTGPIWLDDVQCTGSEPSLSLCLHRPFGTHNCQHWEDAGVRCAPGEGVKGVSRGREEDAGVRCAPGEGGDV